MDGNAKFDSNDSGPQFNCDSDSERDLEECSGGDSELEGDAALGDTGSDASADSEPGADADASPGGAD